MQWTVISGHVEGIVAERSALDQADLVAVERAVAEAEAFGAASEKTMRYRAIALTEAKQQASASASASAKAALSTSRAREALRAVKANFAMKNRWLPEAGAPAGGLSLAPAAPAVGLPAAPAPLPALGYGPARPTLLPGTSHQYPPSEVAVDARTRRPGDTDFLQGSVTCMAAGPYKYLPPKEVIAVVLWARSLREELPEDDFSVSMAWIQKPSAVWTQAILIELSSSGYSSRRLRAQETTTVAASGRYL